MKNGKPTHDSSARDAKDYRLWKKRIGTCIFDLEPLIGDGSGGDCSCAECKVLKRVVARLRRLIK